MGGNAECTEKQPHTFIRGSLAERTYLAGGERHDADDAISQNRKDVLLLAQDHDNRALVKLLSTTVN